MDYFNTTKASPKFSIPACSKFHIGIFDAGTLHWPEKARAWLGEMQAEGLGYSAIHTLEIEDSGRSAIFQLLVCEAMNPLPPLPANISDCFGSGCRFGDVVITDGESPALRIHRNFWAGPSDGDSHFEDTILPLMKKLIADFKDEVSP